jgi:hypothetical protein
MALIVAGTPRLSEATNSWPNSACGLYTFTQSEVKGFEISKRFAPFCGPFLKGLHGGLHFSFALLLVASERGDDDRRRKCKIEDIEVSRPRPPTFPPDPVRQGNGGGGAIHLNTTKR